MKLSLNRNLVTGSHWEEWGQQYPLAIWVPGAYWGTDATWEGGLGPPWGPGSGLAVSISTKKSGYWAPCRECGESFLQGSPVVKWGCSTLSVGCASPG